MKEFIPCVCLTCGVRNNFTHENGFCQNDHDDWLEFRDFQLEGEWSNPRILKRAMKLTGYSREELEQNFMNPLVTQFPIKTRKNPKQFPNKKATRNENQGPNSNRGSRSHRQSP